jgi:hypothetical protein
VLTSVVVYRGFEPWWVKAKAINLVYVVN